MMKAHILTGLLAATMFSGTALAADAASGKKPGETFQDCADCQTMVVIPAGSFMIGSPPEEREREGVPSTFGDHEGPQREITFARPFAIATTETTRAQWARFVTETARPIPTECANYNAEDDSWAGKAGEVVNWQNPGFAQTDDHPAVCISRDDAVDYAAWLSKKTGHRYRLPSESEWEYAARGGTSTARPWGDSVTPICLKANIMTSATYAAINNADSWTDELLCSSANSWTVPVASFDANDWGIHDMLGSVWEWVEDCAAPDHATLPADGKPQTAENGGDCKHRLTKGGAFHSRVWLARPAVRGGGQEGHHRPVASGIRVVREID
ncbi:formylglycine-generating enzyme family protein [Blastomonas fulva]|uniref:formylglycine-generating enzyme family protein n=1 Tax=Blastomonas fulva TaxID=1550728 RepID=UPI003F6F10AF